MRRMIAGIASALVVACGDGSESRATTVVVFKSLGSLQCTGGGTTLTALQGQLMAAGIEVLAAMCGNGRMLSFAPLSTAPAAVITPCR